MAKHDASRRRLFSHRAMIVDLLTGFIDEPWIEEIELESLERVPSNLISDTFRDRDSDVIWKLRVRDQWVYIYVLVEFQSTVNHFMALRLLAYIGLLYQDLIRSEQVTKDNLLPPVLPIVLYNGTRPWTAPHGMGQLIAEGPTSLARYRFEFDYLLLEERSYEDERLSSMNNLVAAFFRMENSRSIDHCREVLAALKVWLAERNQQALTQSFADWLRRIYLPSRLPAVTMPPAHSLEEITNMLEEQSIDWTREWREKGWNEGHKEGCKEGELKVLMRLLERKFGPLNEMDRKKISEADCDQLLEWAERILTAERIKDVLSET